MSDVRMSLFRSFFDTNPETITDEVLVQKIKNDELIKDSILKARDALIADDKKSYDAIKQKLPAVTTSALCSGGRKKSNILELNNLLCLDIDKLSLEEHEEFISEFKKWKHTHILFTSPSGNGVKVIVRIKSDLDSFKNKFEFVSKLVKEKFNIDCDPSCKDPNRLCFLSHDPDVYYNPDSDFIEYVAPVPPVTPLPSADVNIKRNRPINNTATAAKTAILLSPVIITELEKIERRTNAKAKFEEGNRDNYLHLFVANANREGIVESHVDQYCQKFVDEDFTKNEIEGVIHSAYNRYEAEFNTSKSNDNQFDFRKMAEEASIVKDVFKNLPNLISDFVNYFDDQKRDVAFLSLITALSGAMFWIRGRIGEHKTYPNLFAMQVGSAGSGKGTASHSLQVIEGVANSFDNSYDIFSDTENLKLLIAGNNSVSNMILRVVENKGARVIFETEADSISNNYGNDWGDATNIHRAVFHNEPINYERMENGSHFCPCPHYSMNITCTPNQVRGIVRSKENGMLSRVIYYLLKTNPEYQNHRPQKNGNYKIDNVIERTNQGLGDWFSKFRDKKIMFELTDAQWTKFDEQNEEVFYNWKAEFGEDKHDIIVRNNNMKFKIMMILTALRNNGDDYSEKNNIMTCNEVDFKNAMQLGETIFKGSLYVIDLLEQSNKNGITNDIIPLGKMDEVLNRLDSEFKTSEYIKPCNLSEIPERTAYRYLKTDSNIRKIRRGCYKKIAS